MRRILCIGILAGLTACAATTPQGPLPPAVPVFFQPWSAALDNNALSAIASAAQGAKAMPEADVSVTGAADSQGSQQANIYLSKTRAQVVADQLAADGVDPSRIRVHGVGIVPATGVPDGTPAQFARRVVIQVGG
jgi:outer membrane protein OmpA-like peptidoglycan-associated protein